MEIDVLMQNCPVLFHMAAKGSWESIAKHGLLSTSSLLDLFEVNRDLRVSIEECHRPRAVLIKHPIHGAASIRDQKPMSDSGLRRSLMNGLKPRDWYRILNDKVFFWTSIGRLHTLLSARAYAETEHDVLFLDGPSLIRDQAERVLICPMNSGATAPYAHPRGSSTFQSIQDFDWGKWRARRRASDIVVELAVAKGVLNVQKYVKRVVRMRKTDELQTIFEV